MKLAVGPICRWGPGHRLVARCVFRQVFAQISSCVGVTSSELSCHFVLEIENVNEFGILIAFVADLDIDCV